MQESEATGAQDPFALLQGLLQMLNVLKCVDRDDRVKAFGAKRKAGSIGGEQRDLGLRTGVQVY